MAIFEIIYMFFNTDISVQFYDEITLCTLINHGGIFLVLIRRPFAKSIFSDHSRKKRADHES